jgi:upstream activation factor subunit UAF30
VSKQRQRSNRQKNTTSGFMKQVPISKEMAKFANWDPSQLRSRVEVTKFICDYVKQHNLQNPQDRRQILPDDKLSKLLNYDAKKSDKPLTYYYLQRVIQPHFNGVAKQ